MAKVRGGIGQNLSGTIGGISFVNRNGTTYVRAMPRPRKESEWTEKQRQARGAFAAVIAFALSQKVKVIIPIWNKAAKGTNKNGFNLFVSANRAAFDHEGKVGDPKLLHFSTGRLPLPFRVTAEAEVLNPKAVNVRWKDQLNDPNHVNDCLMAVTYQGMAQAPFNTGFTRKDCQATFEIPASEEEERYVYLFFWNKKQDQYSEDMVIAI